MTRVKPKAVDLFCGAGGLSLGLRWAGFDLVYAADCDRNSIKSYCSNLGPHAHEIEISLENYQDIAAGILAENGSVDLVAGGPPCQGFSIQRRGSTHDLRNDFLVVYILAALELNANIIVFENVPTIFGSRGRSQIQYIDALLSESSYTLYKKVLQAADYGVPQLRRRAIGVAIKNSFLYSEFTFCKPRLERSNYKTVLDAIGEMPEPPEDYMPHPIYSNHQRRRITEINLKRLSYVPEGGGRLDIPDELRLACHKDRPNHRHLDVYGRMSWSQPAPTITAMFDNFTRGRFAHPTQNRNITNREGARLQSFPDDFVFYGDQKSIARQIGNAVPPLLANALGCSLVDYLIKQPSYLAGNSPSIDINRYEVNSSKIDSIDLSSAA
jgi:DNA (cytosine-5)-methyltransferase 1